MRFIMPFLLSWILSIADTAQADVYKWTDAEGNVHYGDEPTETSNQVQKLEFDAQPGAMQSGPRGLRPGELRMLKRIERDRKRAAKVRRKRARQAAAESRRQALGAAELREKCDAFRERIGEIQIRLRQAHSGKQGAKLHRTRRKIADQIQRYCK